MAEGHRPVVGIALLDEHMAVEAAHLRDGEHADAAEGAGGHGQHFAFCHIGAQLPVGSALQPEEGDLAGGDVALQGAAGEVRVRAGGLQQAVLDELVFHCPVGAQLAAGGVAAVEAHKGVGELVVVAELAPDLGLVHRGGHGVVDVKQCDGVAGDAHADVLGEGAVDVHLAGHGDAPGGQAGVDVAGLEAELAGEGRPTFVGKGHILAAALVVFRPIQQGQLKLGHALQHVGVVLALAHFLGHVGAHIRDAGIFRVLLVGDQQIQLGVFLNLHAQVVQALDGGVAGEEVLGPGAKGDDLQVLNADDGPGNGHKLRHLVRQLLGGAHGILGDVASQAPQPQVVGAVEHAAVGVAPAVDQVAVALGGSHKHAGAVKVLGDEGLGGFGAKVA